LAECFSPEETSFRSDLIKEFWPKDSDYLHDKEENIDV